MGRQPQQAAGQSLSAPAGRSRAAGQPMVGCPGVVLVHPEGGEQWLLQVRIHGRALPGAIAAPLSYWGSNWEDREATLRAAHGEANLDRLRALKQRMDPENRFGLHQNIPPG